MYGKLENGRFKKAKHFIVDGEATIINPTDAMYEKHGYKKLVEDEIPELMENQYLSVLYDENEKEIKKHYEVKTQIVEE